MVFGVGGGGGCIIELALASAQSMSLISFGFHSLTHSLLFVCSVFFSPEQSKLDPWSVQPATNFLQPNVLPIDR